MEWYQYVYIAVAIAALLIMIVGLCFVELACQFFREN